jgi:hypothetical protein
VFHSAQCPPSQAESSQLLRELVVVPAVHGSGDSAASYGRCLRIVFFFMVCRLFFICFMVCGLFFIFFMVCGLFFIFFIVPGKSKYYPTANNRSDLLLLHCSSKNTDDVVVYVV